MGRTPPSAAPSRALGGDEGTAPRGLWVLKTRTRVKSLRSAFPRDDAAVSRRELDFQRRVVVIHGPQPVRRVDRLRKSTLAPVEPLGVPALEHPHANFKRRASLKKRDWSRAEVCTVDTADLPRVSRVTYPQTVRVRSLGRWVAAAQRFPSPWLTLPSPEGHV